VLPDEAPQADLSHPEMVLSDHGTSLADRLPESEPRGATPTQTHVQQETAPVRVESNGSAMPHVTPVVARIAAEHNVDVRRVTGTGRDGRVTKKDIMEYIEQKPAKPAELDPWEQPGTGDLFKPTDDLYKKAVLPAAASTPVQTPRDHVHQAPPSPGRPGELVPLSTMRRRIAEHMVHSKLHTAPHVTTVFEADLSAVSAHRNINKTEYAQRSVNLTFTAYFMAATAEALRRHPMVNSQWTDEGILLKPEVNIGMAVALDEGLIVPVLKNVDELSLLGIARQVNDLANRARSNGLRPEEISGGTFTITNHGVSGSLFATPIINQPQTGILGVGAIQKRVVVLDNDAIAVRPMVYLSFTFDHRVLDGATADWFVAEIVKLLENWQ
jgi:2-oxoglutarate dehydrogenase E2 component (dihydrolipoamide succinyltransferase)